MKYNNFMKNIIAHYGPYKSDISKKITVKYIMDTFQESELDEAFFVLTKKVSNQYKTPPDPAKFEEIFNDNWELEALHAWEEVNNKVDSLSNVVFADVRVQATIESMGGWVMFCQRPNDKGSEVWAKKEFMHYFKLYTENKPKRETRELPGRYSNGRHETIYIGNVDKKLLAESKSQEQIEDKISQNFNTIK